ncbi:Glucitol operon repressor [compost metagenome]
MAVDGEVKLAELKAMFDVTEMTLRRDMEKLEQWGHIKRTFGGAIIVGNDITLLERTGVFIEEKVRIGKLAAQRIQPGESIFLDGGSTTLQVARFIPANQNITVVTNALNIAAELQGKQISTIVIGGMLMDQTSTLVGPVATQALEKMAFNRAFIGTTGVSLKHGFSNSNMHESEIKRLAIQQASEVNVVMDHSKFGKQDLFSFASLKLVDRIITDQMPDQAFEEAFKEETVDIVTNN